MENIPVIKFDKVYENIYNSNNEVINVITKHTQNLVFVPVVENNFEKYNSYFNQNYVSTIDEYYVIVKEHEHLESLYEELETEGKTPSGLNITRAVECVARKPLSRSTLYKLTQVEANALQNDERVLKVEYNHPAVEIKNSIIQASNFDKSSWPEDYFDDAGQSENKTEMVNWGLLRCTLESQGEYPTWGNEGQRAMASANNSHLTGTIELTQTGKNVDLVVIDDYMVVPDHPEWYTKPDGTGKNRLTYFNWWQYKPQITGDPAGTYPALGNTTYWGHSTQTYHPSHCMGIAGGITMGWAKEANLYHLYMNGETSNTLYDYVRLFHRNKPINPITKRKNPTITTNSYGHFLPSDRFADSWITKIVYRGVTYEGTVYDGVNYDKSFTRMMFNYYNDVQNLWGGYIPDPSYYQGWTIGYGSDAIEYCMVDYDFSKTMYGLLGAWPRGYELDPTTGEPTNASGHKLKSTQIFDDYDTEIVYAFYHGTQYKANLRSYMLTTGEISGLTSSTTPTYGTNDDGYWELNVPFNFRFGTGDVDTPVASSGVNQFIFNKLYINTNQTITFAAPSLTKTPHYTTSAEVINGVFQSDVDGIDPFGPAIGWQSGQKQKANPSPGENLNHSIQRIYYGVTGTTPNRKFHVRIEGDYNHTAAVGSSGKIWEITCYERENLYTDFQLTGVRVIYGESNAVFRRGANFNGYIPTNDLKKLGLKTTMIGQGVPFKYSTPSADVEELIKEGVIFVGSGGNSQVYSCVKGDVDYDNYLMAENDIAYGGLNPEETSPGWFDELYWMRGSSPNTNELKSQGGDFDTPVICVGSVDSAGYLTPNGDSLFYMYFGGYDSYVNELKSAANALDAWEYKSDFSNYGSNVDIWAPGSNILSVFDTDHLESGESDWDHRSKLYTKTYAVGKISGTSMAGPQVAGVLACALETYPYWTQYEAKEYITSYAKQNKLVATWGIGNGYTYSDDLNIGTANCAWPEIVMNNNAAIFNQVIIPGILSDYYKDNNKYLYYYKERKTTGTVFPKANVKLRPTEGAVFPRPRIRRSA